MDDTVGTTTLILSVNYRYQSRYTGKDPRHVFPQHNGMASEYNDSDDVGVDKCQFISNKVSH